MLTSDQLNPAYESRAILNRVARGDKSAVADCINSYGNVIWSLAKKSSFSIEEAEDAVLEIFKDIWAAAKKFNASDLGEAEFIFLIVRRRLGKRNQRIADESYPT